MSVPVLSAGHTEVGKVRRHNEDAILVRDDLGLWVVADGLGGHAAGDYASAMIVERLGALPRTGSVHDFVESIEDCLQQVNADLRAAARARRVDVIASTVAMLVHDSDFVLCGWAGDSRVYGYEDGVLHQLTRDHIHGAKSEATQWGLPSSPAGGALTRAVGAEDQFWLDWVVAGNRPGMQFVLCSDGINKELSDAELASACRRHARPGDALEQLFGQALGRAARDNLSAIVVRMLDPEDRL